MTDAAAIRIVIQDDGGGQADPAAPPRNPLGSPSAPTGQSNQPAKPAQPEQETHHVGDASRAIKEALEPIVRQRLNPDAPQPGTPGGGKREKPSDQDASDAATNKAVREVIRAAEGLPWIGPLVRAIEGLSNPVIRFGRASEALQEILAGQTARRQQQTANEVVAAPEPRVHPELAKEASQPDPQVRPAVQAPEPPEIRKPVPQPEPEQQIRRPVPQQPAVTPPVQAGAASKAFEESNELEGLNLKGMGQAISENLRKALHDAVSATGNLPEQEKGGFVGKAYEHLTTKGGEQKGTATLDKAIAMAEAEIARRAQTRKPIEPTATPQPIAGQASKAFEVETPRPVDKQQPQQPAESQPAQARQPDRQQPDLPDSFPQIRRPVPQPTELPVIRERIPTRQVPDTLGVRAGRATKAVGNLIKSAALDDWQSPNYRQNLRRKALRAAAGIRRTWKAAAPRFGMASRAAAASRAGGAGVQAIAGGASAAVRAGAAASAAGGAGAAGAGAAGGGAVAGAAGLAAAAGPLLVVVGAATAVFAGLVKAGQVLDAKLQESAERLAPFSGALSAAQGRATAAQVREDQAGARQLGAGLARFTEDRAQIERAMQRVSESFQAAILDKFGPLFDGVSDVAEFLTANRDKMELFFRLGIESFTLDVRGLAEEIIKQLKDGNDREARKIEPDIIRAMFEDIDVVWNGRRFGAKDGFEIANMNRPMPQLELP